MTQAFNIDCMEAMSQMKDNEYDLAIVDPPYGIGMDNQKVRTKPDRPNTYLRKGETQYKNSEWDNAPPRKKYFTDLFRVSKNQIIWGANYFTQNIPNGRGWIYWDKQMGDNQFSSGEFAYQSIYIKSSFFSWPSMRVNGTRIHPTQKPVALYKWLLKNYAKEGDKILDTHLGSGSSRIAAHEMGYTFTGYEIDKDYFEAQEKRFANHIRQGNLFEAKEMY